MYGLTPCYSIAIASNVMYPIFLSFGRRANVRSTSAAR